MQYRPRWFTFLVSKTMLNATYFGDADTIPSQIIPILSSKLIPPLKGIDEITHLKDVAHFDPETEKIGLDHIYRIVSDHQIANFAVCRWFQGFDDNLIPEFHQEMISNAYPLLYARSNSFPSFKVADELWHTSGVEAIGSSIDLSWVAGENVARLVGKDIEKDRKQ